MTSPSSADHSEDVNDEFHQQFVRFQSEDMMARALQ